MSLIQCDVCNKKVSSNATICPNCGDNIQLQLVNKAKQQQKSGGFLKFLGVIFIIIIILVIASGGK